MSLTCLVRGVGDVGSAVAHRLFEAGFTVALHDSPTPTTARRGMAFADAAFDGACQLEGVTARRLDHVEDATAALTSASFIPLLTLDFPVALALVQPTILVDARLRKRAYPSIQRGMATLTIGLGPNFTAGVTTDLVIETSWEDLGRIITAGDALPLWGEPRALAGHARDRYVYAPQAGVFQTGLHIGALVSQGAVVAHVGDTPLVAPLTGALRGLTRDGVSVVEGTKVIEIDPRGAQAVVRGIGERPRIIAEGVARAVRDWQTGRIRL